MDLTTLHSVLLFIQHSVSLIGILIIVSGVIVAVFQYAPFALSARSGKNGEKINDIRLYLGRIIILGLEFIVAADLIGTTTTPDYYSLGMAAIIVSIRTLLSFSLNRELMTLTKERQ